MLSYIGVVGGTKEKNKENRGSCSQGSLNQSGRGLAGLAVLAGAGSALWGLHSVLKTCELLPIFDNGRFHI